MTNSSAHSKTSKHETDTFFRMRRRSGGARRDRTDDLKLAKLPLSQLSYGPVPDPQTDGRARPQCPTEMVGLGGLEPPTSRLSSARSNQLSYKPEAYRPEPIKAHDTNRVKPGAFEKKEKRRRRRPANTLDVRTSGRIF